MKTIELSFSIFKSEDAFHESFAEIMGFPAFYGHNWDAWIDCMSYIGDHSAGMTKVNLDVNEQLEFNAVEYKFSEELDKSEVFRNFIICTGFVNSRFKNRNSANRLIISN
jgi:RNAse (barnase) inhibitor barstar